jgi:hypothetical protein
MNMLECQQYISYIEAVNFIDDRNMSIMRTLFDWKLFENNIFIGYCISIRKCIQFSFTPPK